MGPLGKYLPNWLPEDPAKNAAARQGLIQAGAALMGGRGNLGEILGDGIMAGTHGYQGAQQQQQQQQLMAQQQQRLELDNRQTLASIARPGQIRDSINRARQGVVSGPGAAASQTITPLEQVPRIGDPARPPPALAQVSPTAPQPSQPVDDPFAYHYANSRQLAADGFLEEAKQEYEIAKAFRPEVREVVEMMAGDKRVMVQLFKDGRPPQVLDGYAPKAEKLHFANTGGATVGQDQFSGKVVSTIQNTQSPDSRASVGVQMRGQNMVDARAREAAEAGRSQVVQSDEGPVLVNTRTGTGQAITAPNGQRLAGVSKPLNDSQSKALLFGSRMQEANNVLASLRAEGTKASIPGSRTPVIGGIVNAFSSDNYQMLDQAKRDFLTATLRRESGAVISDGELANGDKQYFPQIGDSEKVIEQKARNRELAIRGVLAEVPQKKRQSIAPVSELPKKAASTQAYTDAEKERRYQEWKRSQNK